MELEERYRTLFPHLNERQRRLVAAADAQQLGRGGVSQVSVASGLSRPTLHKGINELQEPPLSGDRTRRRGGGRKKLLGKQPKILEELEGFIDPTTRGDPMSPLRWTCKSTRHLAQALSRRGYPVSHQSVAEFLQGLGYSLQGTAKAREGAQHPDRDAQFQYINRLTKRYLRRGVPIISIDTKKKELIGPYSRGGREWQPKGEPEEVLVHDFPDPGVPKAIPYGVYDVGQNLGWVNVGCVLPAT